MVKGYSGSTQDENNISIGVFLDLSKAFDTINHDILICKLAHYGIRGVTLEWFKSYLSNRKQFVLYNSVQSSEKPISCGVPQGSVLGPLFLLFILMISVTHPKLYHVVFLPMIQV